MKLIYWSFVGMGLLGTAEDPDLLRQDDFEVITQDNGEPIYVG